MPVKIQVDAAPGKNYSGTVGFISPTAEFTPKTVETREVRARLWYTACACRQEDPDNVMRQGMPVTIILTGRPRAMTLCAEGQAVCLEGLVNMRFGGAGVRHWTA